MNATLSVAAELMSGTLHGTDRMFAGVSTDTRALSSDELFIALSGPNFDGSDFVEQAHTKGAAGAVVVDLTDVPIAQITVADTRLALGELGGAWRQKQPAKVIGITGSNGKTTLKELTAACLSRQAATLATFGNLNNDIGMPLMLLRIEQSHRYAVLEMGANHAGEIAYLGALAKPDIVVITNAGLAHLEGFGSVAGVAKAKGEILQVEPRPEFAILNAEDEYYAYWRSLADGVNVLSFGLSEGADVHASHIEPENGNTNFRLHLPDIELDISLPLVGLHNVRNACAAAAIVTALDVLPDSIRTGLNSAQPASGRLQPLTGLNGATVFDDSYNANPDSVDAAADFLASLSGEKWLVLGDMFELGKDAEDLHAEAGRKLRGGRISRLFAIGELSRHTVDAFGTGGEWFEAIDDLIAKLRAEIAAGVNVLVKGSRGMRMERIVEAIRAPEELRRET